MTQSGMTGGEIVAVADRMISSTGDVVPADETLKARKLSKTWAVMVSGDVNLLLPVVREAQKKLDQPGKIYDLAQVQLAVSEVYGTLFDSTFTASYLSRYGINTISEFRASGRAQFGKGRFLEICEEIDKHELGIDLLVYGFDASKMPHIFQVSNPGIVTDHDILGYGVIGSGFYMAAASLRRKRLPTQLHPTVYRLLEAKFSSESASGVGSTTTLFTMNSEGEDKSIGRGSVEQIKQIWQKQLEQPEPQEAMDIISKILR
jgi:hypothetical protein